MKKILSVIMSMLFASIAVQAQAQSEDYLPLVREGVRWHYVKTVYGFINEIDSRSNIYYEFKGDSIRTGKSYKKCYVTSTIPEESKLEALVREENKKVYRYLNDNEETLIYDFNPSELFVSCVTANSPSLFTPIENVKIEGVECKRYQLGDALDEENDIFTNCVLVEGIGVDQAYADYFHGNLLYPLIGYYSGNFETVYSFDRVEDLNGTVLYDPQKVTAIADMKVEAAKGDNRYYNLMGQPVSNPSAGIYIHNGKKVIVK